MTFLGKKFFSFRYPLSLFEYSCVDLVGTLRLLHFTIVCDPSSGSVSNLLASKSNAYICVVSSQFAVERNREN